MRSASRWDAYCPTGHHRGNRAMIAPTYFDEKKNIEPIKACHMARTMIHLPYGKERGRYASDRRGVTPTLENAWVEFDAAKQGTEELSVRSEMGKGRILCNLSRKLATTHPRDCSRQDQESLWRVTKHAFPVARCDSVSIGTRHQTAVRPRYLIAHCSRFVYQLSTCCQVGYEVVVREDYHYE